MDAEKIIERGAMWLGGIFVLIYGVGVILLALVPFVEKITLLHATCVFVIGRVIHAFHDSLAQEHYGTASDKREADLHRLLREILGALRQGNRVAQERNQQDVNTVELLQEIKDTAKEASGKERRNTALSIRLLQEIRNAAKGESGAAETTSKYHTEETITKKREQLEQWLGTLGKRCFVNCFELAWRKGGKLTENEIQECDPEVGTEALDTRVSIIKSIFTNGRQLDALRDCMHSPGVKEKTRAEAKRLYEYYENRRI